MKQADGVLREDPGLTWNAPERADMLMPLPTRDVPRQDACSDSRATSCCRDSGATWRTPAEPDLVSLEATPHSPRWRGACSGAADESSRLR